MRYVIPTGLITRKIAIAISKNENKNVIFES
jgi:hypothetical protein